ncbi:MAG: ThiF family adenylyltransferase, partial [Promethearchaeia archaeon]
MNKENYEKFFERQLQIPWLSQEKLNSLKVLILGMGGIGTNVAILCARLGIGTLFMVDNDTIEASNLNRQALYSKRNIGQKKVKVAKKSLDNLDNLNSKISDYDYDLFQDWQQTLDLMKKADIIMNGLDQPEIKRTLVA